MPAGLVRSKADEGKWREAKAAAREQGKGDNYAYITSIYMKMNKSASLTDLQRFQVQDRLVKTAGFTTALGIFGAGTLAGYIGIPALKKHLIMKKQQREMEQAYEMAALAQQQSGRRRTTYGGSR